MKIKKTSGKIGQYLPYLYLMISILLLFLTTFFPQKPANMLIHFLNPKFESGSAVFFVHEYPRYLNIIVYTGLALSGALFFIGLDRLVLPRAKSSISFAFIHVIITLTNSALGFLCGVKVYHLFRGDNPGFFSLSGQTFITLITFLVCIIIYCVTKTWSSRPSH